MADNVKLIANNKKAYHDYFVEEKIEAGIELVGTVLYVYSTEYRKPPARPHL